jgi:hypothetical protein
VRGLKRKKRRLGAAKAPPGATLTVELLAQTRSTNDEGNPKHEALKKAGAGETFFKNLSLRAYFGIRISCSSFDIRHFPHNRPFPQPVHGASSSGRF